MKLPLFALLVLLSGPLLAAERMALFLPEDTAFWNRVALFARAAADDLGVELTTFDGDSDRVKMLRQVDRVLAGKHSYDALIFPNFLQTASHFLRRCESHRIPCVLFNSDLEPELKQPGAIGLPRQNNPFWIAQLVPDDVGSSVAITRELIAQARGLGMGKGDGDGEQRHIELIGINGYQADAPAVRREEGLRQVVQAEAAVTLRQMFYTDWGAAQAAVRTMGAFRRYSDTQVIWSANYRTTNGILLALEQLGKVPGKDVLLNSYDINPETLRQVSSGQVAITAGGHYIEGAWAVVLAHDYLAGHDFADRDTVFQTPLLVVTRDNVNTIHRALEQIERDPESVHRVDFRHFSLADPPETNGWDFSLEAVIRQYLAN